MYGLVCGRDFQNGRRPVITGFPNRFADVFWRVSSKYPAPLIQCQRAGAVIISKGGQFLAVIFPEQLCDLG